ncbi:putative ADP-ribosylation factor GTPase-activating protein AGD11 [Heracleum sosnowskyi]|uniref:ADP-ribosylation factor GTPase-activating protein AGD11 n=1 Tax=Heracleum sosnowskyi TaxID=360622 RepID=A0AAD8GP71_9APIA|nr:putative ADP-ribosylation factor GTPase-activating protein AGD11 [Heracleum sosnowskyi]
MITQEEDMNSCDDSGPCLYDLLRLEPNLPPRKTSGRQSKEETPSSPQTRLNKLLSQPGNGLCADCGSYDPRWVSLNIGSFMCIKCSGVHRSLGVHISKVFSVKLDEWTNEQVDAFEEMGGNTAVNSKYEAYIPDNVSKPKPDASIEERTDFIRRKYEMQQFMIPDASVCCPFPCKPSSKTEKHNHHKGYSLGLAFRNSWRRAEKSNKKSASMAGMVEFIGLIKVNVVRGTNLAVRDMVTSDPYVILSLGNQIVKTRVIKNNLNPVWNEKLMLSIPESIPPLKLLVYDKDTFTNDDFMGEAEIDIQPLVTAARATELVKMEDTMQLGRWVSCGDNTLVSDGIINLIDGKVKQDIVLKLQNVERGVLQIELECVPLTQ